MTEAPTSEGRPFEPVAKEIEKLDNVLLDTLGGSGSVITGALAGTGMGLAIGSVPGAVVGALVGGSFGAIGGVRRASRNR